MREPEQEIVLVDTHCHLNLEGLCEQAEQVWKRARAVGVRQTVVIGIDAASSRAATELAEQFPGVYAAVGIHPTSTAKVGEDEWQEVEQLARASHPRVVALGESGLDFYWPDSPPEIQVEFLHRHVELALALDLPLVLHIRDAYPRAAAELERAASRGLRGIVHCFAGEEHEVLPFVEWGWPIAFGGILTYPKADNVRAAARRTPLEQCLLETDAPWLKPRGAGERGSRSSTNEPAYLVEIARALARIHEVSLEEIAEITTSNARRTFSLG